MHQSINFRAMGSEMLAIVDKPNGDPESALEQVPAWFEEWEQCLSRFRPDSELSRLNGLNNQPVAVSETLWDVVDLSRFAEVLSGGLITPTVHDALLDAGYDRDIDELRLWGPRSSPASNARAVDPLSAVLFDEGARTICLPEGVRLDLGGVAKGWSAHQAMLRLAQSGPALVDAAGDIALSGPQLHGKPWIIGVADPMHPGEDLLRLLIAAGGIATSGKDRRRWKQGGRWKHHLINPLSGEPADTDLLTVTVLAETVMEAEIAAKTIFLLGTEDGMEWAEERPELAALLIRDRGEIVLSDRMHAYVQQGEEECQPW